MRIVCDASREGLGTVLQQVTEIERRESPLCIEILVHLCTKRLDKCIRSLSNSFFQKN